MAVWQVGFALLPEHHFAADGSIPDEKLLALVDHAVDPYEFYSLPLNYRADVDVLLKPKKGWAEALEIWGEEKSDDFSIWREDDGRINTIDVRIDVGKLDDALLSGLLNLAKKWLCVLVEERYRTVCRMDLKEFRALIAGHPHSRATREPKVWLDVLVEEVKRAEEEDGK